MECSQCKKTKDSFIGGICFDCYGNMNKLITQPSTLKVQFFEGSILEIQDHMNKFFKQEKVGRDRLIEIKYIKNNSVMVVYV